MYYYKVNMKRFESSEPIITGKTILNKAGLIPEEDYELLYKVNEKGFTPIQLDEKIDLKKVGIEGLKAVRYKSLVIKVDDKDVEVENCFMTPLEIMAIANIDSNNFYLIELRKGNVEVTYEDDVEHKIAIHKNSCFVTCPIEIKVECVIVNAKNKPWSKSRISFEEVVILAYDVISQNPNIIYTVNYVKGVANKPEGSMIKGDEISVKNKMIFNVTRTDKS
ncbi:multiubiquitin domain-containing protein [Maribacter sp. LLG6340-A2]|uniref:multiubiquitin domain-containing protein n=1 Tax=Maribacter sp. LLG6340-A2 TaxID=3160834 RepID=UPI00386A88DE